MISQNQSGFKPSDSCVNQFLSATHEIYKFLDDGREVTGVFLDISKAFGKVWDQGVILKLKQNGISGNLLKIIKDFLSNRYQRIYLNGDSSGWAAVNAGVCQSLIIGPLMAYQLVYREILGLLQVTRLFFQLFMIERL